MEYKLAVDTCKAGMRRKQVSVGQDFSHIAELCLVLIYYTCCLKKKLSSPTPPIIPVRKFSAQEWVRFWNCCPLNEVPAKGPAVLQLNLCPQIGLHDVLSSDNAQLLPDTVTCVSSVSHSHCCYCLTFPGFGVFPGHIAPKIGLKVTDDEW